MDERLNVRLLHHGGRGVANPMSKRWPKRALDRLLAPIERVTGFDTVMPLPKLERDYLPGVERITAALRRTLAND